MTTTDDGADERLGLVLLVSFETAGFDPPALK
jgi:hypothetical protein